ncbi:ABC transporter substrate-binding protein [Pusillimonas sp.]|uniref:ABC transporter substrate-binding protein n=1 Tax=Pusillimonas sp. TaxID=3040095 RepID=UPI0029B39600|nr:ABC transporter substrate-binding protein [Pusillimonas sp.]MDX3895840.1 ABC transporter substrate-binding protein [Pusillimonas sp.]
MRRLLIKSAATCLVGGLLTAFSAWSHAQDTIKVGVVAPMSGTFSPYGLGFYHSMQAYMENYGDTVAGKKVEIIVRDNSTNSPDTAKRLAQELITRDHVDFLTGFALSSDAFAVATLATQAKKPTILMLSAALGLTEKSPYLARVSYSNYQASAIMAKWAHKNGIRKAYTVVSDYAPGIDSENGFKEAFEQLGGTLVGKARIPLHNNNYAPYVQHLKDANAEGVFVFLPSGEPMVSFMKNYTERGLPGTGMKLMTSTDLAEEYIKPLGDTAVHLTNSIQYYDTLDNAENKKYIAAYSKIAGKLPGAIALGGYDGMALIYAVANKLNGEVSDGAKVMETIKGITIESPRGSLTIDADTRDAVANMYIAAVEQAPDRMKPVVIDTFENVTDAE